MNVVCVCPVMQPTMEVAMSRDECRLRVSRVDAAHHGGDIHVDGANRRRRASERRD